jgi:diadenylate cyclase
MSQFFYLINNLYLKDILDILLLAGIIFLINLIIIKARAFRLIIGIIILVILDLISDWMNLVLTKALFQTLLPLSFIILAFVFQKEIKMFLEQFVIIIPRRKKYTHKEEKIIENIMTAIKYLSESKIGSIIVFEKVNSLESLIEGGKKLNSEISAELLISIFSKNSPLHDGALIIKDDKIKYASVHLPLAENYQFDIKAGTRHRAGLGITQFSDALSIIISEENGNISIAKNNKINYNVSGKEILRELQDYYQTNTKHTKIFTKTFKNIYQYIAVFALSLIISFSFWILVNYNKFKIQKTIEAPIEFKNLKDNLSLIDPSANKIKISLSGYDFDIKTLNESQIKAIIDLSDAEEGRYSINIDSKKITNIRPNIEIVQIEPNTIKFKIINKEKPNQNNSENKNNPNAKIKKQNY